MFNKDEHSRSGIDNRRKHHRQGQSKPSSLINSAHYRKCLCLSPCHDPHSLLAPRPRLLLLGVSSPLSPRLSLGPILFCKRLSRRWIFMTGNYSSSCAATDSAALRCEWESAPVALCQQRQHRRHVTGTRMAVQLPHHSNSRLEAQVRSVISQILHLRPHLAVSIARGCLDRSWSSS